MNAIDAGTADEPPRGTQSGDVPSPARLRRALLALAVAPFAISTAVAQASAGPGMAAMLVGLLALAACFAPTTAQLVGTVALLPLLANPMLWGGDQAPGTLAEIPVAMLLLRILLRGSGTPAIGRTGAWLAALVAVAAGSWWVAAAREHDLLSAPFVSELGHQIAALGGHRDALARGHGLQFGMDLLVACLLAIVTGCIVRGERQRRALALTVAAVVAISAGIALVQMATGYALTPFGVELSPGVWTSIRRAQAGWPDANAFAAFLVLTTPIALVALRRPALRAALLSLVTLALLATGSRAALLAMALQLGLVAGTRFGHGGRRFARVALAVLLVAVLSGIAVARLAPSSWIEAGPHRMRVLAPLDGTLEPHRITGGRLELWRNVAFTAARHPVFGIGAGQLSRRAPELWLATGRPGVAPLRNAHSYPLQIAAELGMPGLALLLGLIGGALRASWRAAAAQAGPTFTNGLGVGLIGYLPMLLLGHPMLLPEQLWLVAMLLAAGDAAPSPARRGSAIAAALYGLVWASTLAGAMLDPPTVTVYGAHGVEVTASGHRFRWIAPTTVLRVHGRRGPVDLVLSSELPALDGRPLAIRAYLEDGTEAGSLRLQGNGVARLRLMLPHPERATTLELRCDRGFRPSELRPASRDPRLLCAQLWDVPADAAAILPISP